MKKSLEQKFHLQCHVFSVEVLEGIDQFSAGELQSPFSSWVETQDIKPYVVTVAFSYIHYPQDSVRGDWAGCLRLLSSFIWWPSKSWGTAFIYTGSTWCHMPFPELHFWNVLGFVSLWSWLLLTLEWNWGACSKPPLHFILDLASCIF